MLDPSGLHLKKLAEFNATAHVLRHERLQLQQAPGLRELPPKVRHAEGRYDHALPVVKPPRRR